MEETRSKKKQRLVKIWGQRAMEKKVRLNRRGHWERNSFGGAAGFHASGECYVIVRRVTQRV